MRKTGLSIVKGQIRIGLIIMGVMFLLGLFLIFKIIQIWKSDDQRVVETTSQVVVQEITDLGRLELVQYHMKDVITRTIKNEFWFDTKVLVLVSGEVIGCIDLEKISHDDIYVEGDSISIKLPKPELCVVKVDHQNTKVFDSDFTVIDYLQDAQGDIIQETFADAEGFIADAALEQGILDTTKVNGVQFFQQFLLGLGFKKTFIYY